MNKPDARESYNWAHRSKNFLSRVGRRIANNLGVVAADANVHDRDVVRCQKLDRLESYYDNTQYNHLLEWDRATSESDDYIAVRSRKPRIIYPFARMLASRLTAKVVGQSVFPKFTIEESPEDQEFLETVIDVSNLRSNLLEPVRRAAGVGSCFIRFWIIGGRYRFEWIKSKYCYPVWDDSGELESVEIKFVFIDDADRGPDGMPKKKWHRMILTTTSEISFDNPEYKPKQVPEFLETSRIDHDLGFVPGQWLRTDESSVDGAGFVDGIEGFIDEFNYSLSQTSQAVAYNQEPQLVFNGMTEDETEAVIRSSTKSWNLGKEGKADFVEAGMKGVETAGTVRDKIQTNLSDITRITVHDPEKLIGSAQSAKAMEVLHGPLKDLVDELRLVFGPQIRALVEKLAMAALKPLLLGLDGGPITFPPGYAPKTISSKVKWPAIFQQTLEDFQKKVQVAAAAKNAGLISPYTATRYVAEDFGVEDIEAELKAIEEHQAAVAALNPFGGF